MKAVHRSFTDDAARTMVQAFVTSQADYCNSVLHRESAVHIQPLHNVLNAAAWIRQHKQKFDRITADLRDQLHWLPVQHRIRVQDVYAALRVFTRLRTNLARRNVHISIYISQLNSPLLCNTWRSGSTSLRTENKYGQRCFWSYFVENSATDCARPITDSVSVLCALEGCAILRSL